MGKEKTIAIECPWCNHKHVMENNFKVLKSLFENVNVVVQCHNQLCGKSSVITGHVHFNLQTMKVDFAENLEGFEDWSNIDA